MFNGPANSILALSRATLPFFAFFAPLFWVRFLCFIAVFGRVLASLWGVQDTNETSFFPSWEKMERKFLGQRYLAGKIYCQHMCLLSLPSLKKSEFKTAKRGGEKLKCMRFGNIGINVAICHKILLRVEAIGIKAMISHFSPSISPRNIIRYGKNPRKKTRGVKSVLTGP